MESYLQSLGTVNNICRYTHGYFNEDSGRFVCKGTLEYFMTEGVTDIGFALHNRLTSKELPKEITDLKDKLFDRSLLFNLSENECIDFMNETYRLLDQYGISDREALTVLK